MTTNDDTSSGGTRDADHLTDAELESIARGKGLPAGSPSLTDRNTSDIIDEILRAQALLAIYKRSVDDDEHSDDLYLLDTVGTILGNAATMVDQLGIQQAQEVRR